MNQEELAIRTGFSPKHISEVVNGKKGISPSFAKALDMATIKDPRITDVLSTKGTL